MTLSDLEAAGACVNAGYLDIYHEGAHKRLAQVSPGGDLNLTPEGEAFVRARKAAEPALVPTDEIVEPVVTKPATKRAPKAKPAEAAVDPVADATPPDADPDAGLASELGEALGSLGG